MIVNSGCICTSCKQNREEVTQFYWRRVCQLHERSENGSMPWHRFEKEVEKEPSKWLSDYQNHKMTYQGEAFEVEAMSSCLRLQLHKLCLGLVRRKLRPVLITLAWGGVGSLPSERSVWSNTDTAFCRVSERSGHHHGSALGWGHRASLTPTCPSALPHGWMWWQDINSSIGVLCGSSLAAPPALALMACWGKGRQDQDD